MQFKMLNRPSRVFYISLILLALATASMIILRITQTRAYLYIAMISPLFGVTASALHAWYYLGKRQAVVFFFVTVIGSMFLETLGVATGWLYGEYHYTYRLGPLFLGLTPYLIPITWFMMLYPSFIMSTLIADRISIKNSILRVLIVSTLGGMIMTSWDLVLDPVMVVQEHWVWDEVGAYFGIPFQNFFGWWLTSFVILLIHQWLVQRIDLKKNSTYDHLAKMVVPIYLIVGSGNIAGAAITGLWGPSLIALVAMSFWSMCTWQSKPSKLFVTQREQMIRSLDG